MSGSNSMLCFADWMYHTFHLAGSQETCGDCKICVWYARRKGTHA